MLKKEQRCIIIKIQKHDKLEEQILFRYANNK